MAELDDKNVLHAAAKLKIIEFACDPARSPLTRTAERDLSLTPVTAVGLREAICIHVQSGKSILLERLDIVESRPTS